MEGNEQSPPFRVAKVKFSVGQHVRIIKEKKKFAKGVEQTFSTEIFRFTKSSTEATNFHELEDLNKTPIEGQSYVEELKTFRISKETTYKIDKILEKRVTRGIREYLVRWKVYSKDFDSWIPASSVKNI